MTRHALLLLLLLGACDGGTTAAPALLPPPLAPVLAALQAAALPPSPPPAPAVQQQLRELAELALVPGAADARTAARAEASLRQQPAAAWILETLLADPDAHTRSRAAFLLGQLGQQAAIVPLLLRLKYENDPSVQPWLAEALHRLGNDAALPLLVAAMDRADTAEPAGQLAISVLRDAGAELSAAPSFAELQQQLQRRQRHWRQHGVAAARAPAPADAATDARLCAQLAATEGFALRPVDEARFVLGHAGRLALPRLQEALQASEPYLRNVALLVLIELGPAALELAEPVLPLLSEPISAPYAARALGELRSRAAIPHLRLLLDAADIELRAAAAGALGPLGDLASKPRLQALLADAQQALDVRVQAAFSLALFELDRPARAFLRALRQRGGYHQATLDRLLQRLGEGAAATDDGDR